MNWGARIAILYLGFVTLILVLAFTCFGQKVELESKDYYARELKFQDQLDAARNSNSLDKKIEHITKGKSVEIQFPKELLSSDLKGSITFFRPSDSSKDKTVAINPGPEGKQFVNDKDFISGVYKMQIAFFSNGKNYYQEDIINFH